MGRQLCRRDQQGQRVDTRDRGDQASRRRRSERGPRSPGQSTHDPITLQQGVTHDVAFQQWANKVWDYPNSTGTGPAVSLKDFRKDITIELFNESGQKVLAYNVYRCWVSEFQAMPELDGLGNAVAIQTLRLENEGWERDTSVIEPVEASFTDPEK